MSFSCKILKKYLRIQKMIYFTLMPVQYHINFLGADNNFSVLVSENLS